jgi:hypothetical protein
MFVRTKFVRFLLAGCVCLGAFVAASQAQEQPAQVQPAPKPKQATAKKASVKPAKVMPVAAPAQETTPPPPPPPLTLAQKPSSPPRIFFQNGLLTIVAENSTLGDILRAVHTKTGAVVDVPGNATERVVSQLGPAPAREVLAALLNGSHFNYVIMGSATNPDAVQQVILTPKSGEAGVVASEAAKRGAGQPEDGQGQEEMAAEEPAADDSNDADNQPDQSQPEEPPAQQPATQGAVKSPEELLRELQAQQQQMQAQQQLQQQLQQGAPQNAPQPPNPPQEQEQPQ